MPRALRLREPDGGTAVPASSLGPAFLERVRALAGEGEGEITVYLPFLDGWEWKRRAEILSGVELVRDGNAIRCVLAPVAAMRAKAAMMVRTDLAWKSAPGECNPRYFQMWQRVSVALQKALRSWIPQRYFQHAALYEDRDAAYPMVVYEASRVCYGRPKTEFTYDVADPGALSAAWKMIGRAMQIVLERIEKRLQEAGRPALARRYAPVWHEDILAAVRKKPRRFVELLAHEAMLVNAVIDLGTASDRTRVNRFAKTASAALRSVYGEDMRALAVRALDLSTAVLGGQHDAVNGIQDFLHSGVCKDSDAAAVWSPEARIGRHENGDDRGPHSGGQVSNAGIVADVNAGRSKPAGEIVEIVEAEGAVERLRGPRGPLDRDFEAIREGPVSIERPVFPGAAGEGVNDSEVFNGGGGHGNAGGDAGPGGRRRWEKGERQVTDSRSKFGAVCAVPGIDGVEGFERGNAGIFEDADEIETGIGDGASAVGKTDQR